VPGEVGEPGSDIGSAVLAALQLVEADPLQSGDLVVITDGEEQGVRVPDAVQRAKARGIHVSAIVLGTAEGASIPDTNGPLRDTTGNIVRTYARADVAQALARGTDGTLNGVRPGAPHVTEVRVPIDRYQWPLAVAFVMLLAGSLVHRGAE
jgi:Ca-activated chloride channel family protein